MKIAVVGYRGVVGGATFDVLRRLGQGVVGVEKEDSPQEADIYMICVPEDFVEDVFLEKVSCFPPSLAIIRSTVLPGTTKALQSKYPAWHFMHIPEYLREATALYDAYFSQYMTFGECCKEHSEMVEDIYRTLGVKIFHTDTTTSEMTKYTINNFKAVLISYWNTLYMLSEYVRDTPYEFDPHQVARIAINDSVISTYGTILGSAYGGKCLPKDIGKYVKFCTEIGFIPSICEATIQVNESVKAKYGESAVRTGN